MNSSYKGIIIIKKALCTSSDDFSTNLAKKTHFFQYFHICVGVLRVYPRLNLTLLGKRPVEFDGESFRCCPMRPDLQTDDLIMKTGKKFDFNFFQLSTFNFQLKLKLKKKVEV